MFPAIANEQGAFAWRSCFIVIVLIFRQVWGEPAWLNLMLARKASPFRQS